jgi:anti-sigma factor RsiW
MSECPNQLRIEAYHDGELSPEVAREVQLHLIDCAPCRDELRALQSMSQFVRSFAPAEMPSRAMDRLHEQVDALTQVDTLRFAKRLSSLAACLLAAAGVWFATTSRTSEASPAPWERAAIMLQLDNTTASAQTGESDTAQWMLASLNGSQNQGD